MKTLVLSVTVALSVSATARTASAHPAEIAQFANYTRPSAYAYIDYLETLSSGINRLIIDMDASDQSLDDIMALRDVLSRIDRVEAVVTRFVNAPRIYVSELRRYRAMVYDLDRRATSSVSNTLRHIADSAVQNGADEPLLGSPLHL